MQVCLQTAVNVVKELYEMPAYVYQGEIIFPTDDGRVMRITVEHLENFREDMPFPAFRDAPIYWDHPDREPSADKIAPVPIML